MKYIKTVETARFVRSISWTLLNAALLPVVTPPVFPKRGLIVSPQAGRSIDPWALGQDNL